jgi:zinc D-Ala-D-Ala carboxypeptidase
MVFDYVKDNLNFDQLIYEFGNDINPDWVHISYESTGKQRKQVLKAVKINGQTKYIPYA